MSLLSPHEAAGCNAFHVKASFSQPDPPKVKRDKDGIPIDPNYTQAEVEYHFMDRNRLKKSPGQTWYNSAPRGIAAAGRDWDDDRGVAPIAQKKLVK